MRISSNRNWLTLIATGLLAASLAGCGGDDGAAGPAGPAGPSGAAGPTGPAGPAGPAASNATAIGSNAVTAPSVITANAAAWQALELSVKVTGVTISGPPVVNFTVADAAGKPVVGLGNASKSATAAVPSYANIYFALAKLVPAANGSPSKWVSYIVTTTPTTTAAAAPTRPSSDAQGTLVDNGDGSYKYTFYRDVTKIKDQVAAMTVTAPNVLADLGDLSYNANATHRLAIVISGNAPGTGSNTPTGATSSVAGVPLKKPIDLLYDFIPATGKVVTAADPNRQIVANAKCEECHRKLGGVPGLSTSAASAGFHGGSRNNVALCSVCHTDQRRYGRTEAAFTANGAVKTFTAAGAYVVDGRTVGDLVNLIHKAHMGEALTNQGWDYAGVKFNDVTYPMDIRNCTKCHDGSATSTAPTPSGDNWKSVPSTLACGACHEGINFKTGTGVKLRDALKGLTSSPFAHPAGAQPDDSACILCHKADSTDLYHLPVTPPNEASALHVTGGNANTNAAWIASNQSRLPPGAVKVTYDIKSVTRNAAKQPVMVFRILADGARKDLNANTAAEIWDGFMGAPSVYYVYSMPQDGIASPSDFNASASVYLKTLWKGTGTGTSAGTLTGPDANGYYTATLTGVLIPDTGKMLTGGLGYSYNVTSTLPLTQINLVDYPTSPATATGQTNKIGGLVVIAPNKQVVAAGYTGRRAIVEDARCNACHQELGAFTEEAFHAGQRNDATTCSWCHTPNKASSGWSADSLSFIHAIHASAKRKVPYNWHAASATSNYGDVTYPGVLNDCETCHLPGTYNYNYDSASAAAQAALDSRQMRTVVSGTIAAGAVSNNTQVDPQTGLPFVTTGLNYGALYSVNAGTGAITESAPTTLVTSPLVTVCLACHDSDDAIRHYRFQGGKVYDPRGALPVKDNESCRLCHASGRTAAIEDVHKR